MPDRSLGRSLGRFRIALAQLNPVVGDIAGDLKRPMPPIELQIDNQIPLGKGLGSSAAALTAGALAFVHFRERPVDHPLVRLSVDLGPDAQVGSQITAAISPDGQRIVFPVRGPDSKLMLATGTPRMTSGR